MLKKPAGEISKTAPKSDDLRGTLMLGFAVLAILPMILAVVFMTRIAETGIAGSTGDLAQISRDALSETSVKIGDLSREQLQQTGGNLTAIGQKAVHDTADALLSASEKRFKDADAQLVQQGEQANQALSTQLIQQGEQANQALSSQLIAQSQHATSELAGELIRTSGQANHDLSEASSRLAARAVVSLADHMVAQASKDTGAISAHIVEQNQASARQLSERLVHDVEREPVVNFKTLASIFARGLATNKVASIRDGYLAVVDEHGHVMASTKFKKGTSLNRLAIVQSALDGTASEDSLLHFRDGNDEYLGVFARRDDGGAVIFAYLAARARVDTDRMKGDLQETLNQMSRASSQYVIGRMDAQRSAMRDQANTLSGQAINQLKATSVALEARAEGKMRDRAKQVSDAALKHMADDSHATAAKLTAAMTARSKDLAAHASQDMNTRSQTIAQAALDSMRPIGQGFAAQAEQAMRAQADEALARTAQIVPKAAEAAAAKATGKMAPEAKRLSDRARHQIWEIAAGLIGLEILLAILASLVMSGRIATPIITEREKAREEKERLAREMEIASKIQTCLLPPVPSPGEFDLALAMVPAEEVGGDFVEVLADAKPGAFWLGIGDVTGHGLTPGLIMMMAQSTFNALARSQAATPKIVYDGMNRVLYQNIKDRLKTSDHMTMSILKHEGQGAFVHCGCHLDILVYRAETKQVERLMTDGPWIGLLPECQEFTVETRFEVAENDVLLLYTDGLIELQDDKSEQWDMDRLCESLARHAEKDAHGIQAAILEDALHWSAKVLDDISLIVVKRGPTEVARTVPKAGDRPAAVKG